MEGAGLPLGRHRGTHAILLSHRGVPGSAQRGPAAGLLGSRGHIQSGETEQSFIKGACVHCGQNAGQPEGGDGCRAAHQGQGQS